MKIESIKISNILTFPHCSDLGSCEAINFDKGLNIIVGPNGVGKSNFAEIVHQLFSKFLFKEFNYNEDIRNNKGTNPTDVLTEMSRQCTTLKKNYWSSTNDKLIKLTISLGRSDIANFKFILDHADSINDIMEKYSPFGRIFDVQDITEGQLLATSNITLVFEDKSPVGQPQIFKQTNAPEDAYQKFIYTYFEYFQFLQKVIEIGNEDKIFSLPPLKNVFALMSSYRNYSNISLSQSLDSLKSNAEKAVRDRASGISAKTNDPGEPLAWQHIRTQLSYDISDIAHSKGHATAVREDGSKV